MTKITTYLAGVSLAIVFLVAAQVNADVIKFSFTQCLPYVAQGSNDTLYRPLIETDFPSANTKIVTADYRDLGTSLVLTATKNGDNQIDFSLTSTWDGADKGGAGLLMTQYTFGRPDTQSVFFRNISDILSGGVAASDNFTRFQTGGFTLSENGTSFLDFTVGLVPGKTWSDFYDLAYSGQFSTLIHLGNLDPDLSRLDYASFITIANDAAANAPDDNSSPEPATLAVLGLGLAGLGLVSRRRRK